MTRILTHDRAHLDELEPIVLLQVFGGGCFPGIEDAFIEFHSSGGLTPDGRSWQEHFAEGALMLGMGGSPFDEHPYEDHERREDECTTTLVAKHLGLSRTNLLAELIGFTRSTDLGPGRNMDLAALVKAMHQLYVGDGQSVFAWVEKVVLAFIEKKRHNRPRGLTLESLVAEWIQECYREHGMPVHKDLLGGAIDSDWGRIRATLADGCEAIRIAHQLGIARHLELGRILAYADRTKGDVRWHDYHLFDQERHQHHQFELMALIERMAVVYSPHEVREWAFQAFHAIWNHQLGFIQACIDYPEAKKFCMEVGAKPRPIRVVALELNSEHANGVARSKRGDKAGVVVQRWSSNHIQVFTDRRQGPRDLSNVVRVIRVMEERAHYGRVVTNWSDLGRDGMVGGVDRWYFHRVNGGRGSMLMNASTQSSRSVPATHLTLEQVFEAALIGLDDEKLQQFRRSL